MAEIVISFSNLDGNNGFQLGGVALSDSTGASVSSAGDVNGDGFDDLIVGAPSASPNGFASGSSYVVFGNDSGFPANLDLSTLDGSNGFRLDGVAPTDQSGRSVSGAGDINGDGFDDLIVGAPGADPNGGGSGSSYVVFGKAGGFAATLNLDSLGGISGFRLDGEVNGGASGQSVSGAGDVNGDGFDDLIVGAYRESYNGLTSGSSYVVFGKESGFPATLNLSTVDGSSGFRLDGAAGADLSGTSVSGAGDVNGDGFDDLIVGAPGVDKDTLGFEFDFGSSYVVFGKAGGFAATVILDSLNGNNGFRLEGVADSDQAGWSVSGAGDVNGDGFDDLIVGANMADPNGDASGSSYVVFGKAGGFAATLNLGSLDGTNGFRLDGVSEVDQSGFSVSGAGDFNGDGFDDLIVGAVRSARNGYNSGSSYVVFGKESGFAATVNLDSLDANSGFLLEGLSANDSVGQSVSGAGDVNGDGFDDLIVGAPGADFNDSASGSSYVVFGSSGDTNNPPTGEVTIDGDAIEGETLTAVNTLADEDGLGEFSYLWRANDVPIIGATSDTLTLARLEAGKTITVTASYIDGQGNSESVESNATTPVIMVVEGTPGPDHLIGSNGDDIIRGFDGKDTLESLSGNDLLEGGDDIDQSIYYGNLLEYTIINTGGEFTVSGLVNGGVDTLNSVERLHFLDKDLAIDLDGNAGTVVKLLGVALGKDNWFDQNYIGIGLDLLDNSTISFESLMDLAIDVVLGGNATNAQVVTLFYTNLVGQGPSQSELNEFVGLIENGTYTQASLGVAAANHELNLANIDFVGLINTGVEYFAV